ncbi:hypothetical protein HK098_005748 [Nowakowskiella sp. JEL0407]|nr:hypothetical protein HK098_005748 [Nowakowskiella sp. JEL0407]
MTSLTPSYSAPSSLSERISVLSSIPVLLAQPHVPTESNNSTQPQSTRPSVVSSSPVPDYINAMAAVIDEVSVKKRHAIIREGATDQFLYIIAKGEAAVFKGATPKNESASEEEDGFSSSVSQSEHEVKLLTLRRGDFLGLGNMLEGKPHSATVVGESEVTTIYRISHADMYKLFNQYPAMALSICRYMTEELRTFRTKLADLADAHDAATNERLGVVRMTVYDSKEYERTVFDNAIERFNAELQAIKHKDPNAPIAKFEVQYFPVKLTMQTAALAAGSKIVCIFVNDNANGEVVAKLSSMGVQMVALRCAGFNQLDLKACQALNISAARVPAYSPYAVAEHCVALLQTLNRHVHIAYNRVKTGNFSLSNLVGKDLHGKTVGVIGTGKIGLCFVKIMVGFGCNILCYDVYRNKELEAIIIGNDAAIKAGAKDMPTIRYVDDLDELYTKSQVISIHCPLMPTTKHMINKETIAKMPRGVILINTSRGGLINTVDLIGGLKTGQIGGAGLDVYEDESDYFFQDKSADIISDDVLARLMTFNNVLITSHQAFLTEEALRAIADTTIFNVKEFVLEQKVLKELTNTVNL